MNYNIGDKATITENLLDREGYNGEILEVIEVLENDFYNLSDKNGKVYFAGEEELTP